MSGQSTVNVASHLSAISAREPNRVAVYVPRLTSAGFSTDQITFAELDRQSGLLARGLHEVGVRRGCRTVLMVTPSLSFFSLTFALFKLGAVPVLIDPGMGIGNLGKCLAEARPEAFIGIPKAHLARRILRWSRDTIRTTVTTGSRLFGGRHTMRKLMRLGGAKGPLPVADTQAEATAAILFTSGSTGVAKGVVYTHGIFAAQVQYLKSVYGIQPGEIDLSTFPLFALFSPALGMTAVIPEMDPTRPALVDPTKIIRAVEHFGVTNLFGSPALINRVGRYGFEHGVKLPTLRRVISAGAPVPAKVIERFTKMLPAGVQVFTPYGATESLPVASIGSDEILRETRHATDQGKGVCVGRPVPGMLVKIIPISDEPLPKFDQADCLPVDEIGEIAVSGPIVTVEYFGRSQATALAKMHDSAGRLWHRMGDLGYLDGLGRIWFCGRKSHRVETKAGTLFTDQVEPVFNTVEGVFRTALVGVADAGEILPVLCVEQEKPDLQYAAQQGVKLRFLTIPWSTLQPLLRERAQQFQHTKEIETFLLHPKFPVDIRHNSKIFREKLAVWAARELKT
jgi:acyl-CoA synthetase (AMP-forming)/AMP-acid ligase II